LKKMSKSAVADLAKVMILDEPKAILKKFKKAVTDSQGVIRYDENEQPGVANLLNIWCAATDHTREQALTHFNHNMYGKLKVETAEAVITLLEPVRDRFQTLQSDRAELENILDRGAQQARERAEVVLRPIMEALGLPPNRQRVNF